MKSMTSRVAVAVAAIALAGCDEPTRPLAPSAPRSAVGAASVAGSTIAFVHITPKCGYGMDQGCDGDGPPGWGWSTYVSLATGGADGTGLVDVTYPVEGNTITQPFAPAWSPDGMRIAFSDLAGEVRVVAGAGGTPVNLTRHAAADAQPTWSPDGARIAFSSDRSGSRELYVMSATDGSSVTRLTNGAGFSGHPDWSADGARILFDCVVEPGNADVCAVNANGTGFVRLTSHLSSDFSADVSPTGRIAFVTTRFGAAPEIADMNGDGSGVTRLGAGTIGDEPDWSPDGGRLAFSRDGAIYAVAADGSNPTWLESGSSPSWRPSDAPLPGIPSPVARLGTATCFELTCTFDASGSTDDVGTQALYYSWDFGGVGGFSYVPTWKQSFPQAGTYTLTLTVTASATGKKATATQSVTVTGSPAGAPPVASFTYSCAGLTCTLDGRGSTDDAAITRYSWNTGNGGETMTGAVVNAIYPSEGSRTVVLTVTDGAGQTNSTSRTFYAAPIPGDAPPVARVSVTCVGLQCDIDARASTDDRIIQRIYIDIGSPGSTPIWAERLTAGYAPGTYTITVTAVDDAGQMGRASKTITVAPLPPPNQAPVASFTYSCVRTKCTFDGRSSTDDNGIASYSWNLGSPSGANLTGAVVTFDYKRAGTYTARLTVRDAAGLSATVARTVTVAK